MLTIPFRLILAFSVGAHLAVNAASPPALLNHQGRIAVDGVNYDGTGYFKFSLTTAVEPFSVTLWSNDGTGFGINEPTTAVPVTITNGHYATLLGDTSLTNMTQPIQADIFADHANVSLRIWFSTIAGGPFELLSPDRRITAAAYSLSAATAETATTAANVSGGSVNDLSFLGTTTDDPLDLSVNNIRGLRLQPGNPSPSLIGGFPGNSIDPETFGNVIGGGGSAGFEQTMSPLTFFGFIGGGGGNSAENFFATVVGGRENTASGELSFVGGGFGNIASGFQATIPGGGGNEASARYTLAAGQAAKAIHDATFVWGDGSAGDFASSGPNQFLISAAGGVGIGTNDPQAALDVAGTFRANGLRTEEPTAGTIPNVINGAGVNTVDAGISGATIAGGGDLGGTQNWITGTGSYGSIGGGITNRVGGSAGTVPGGTRNTADGANSLAAGRRAQALHDGAFVWGDTTEADFSSTGIDQFLIRASGGVGIGTNSPQAGLDVSGTFRATGFRSEEPTVGSSPNIVNGIGVNTIDAGLSGATIAGGGDLGGTQNWVTGTGSYGSIGGGITNRVGGSAGTVPGGTRNTADGANSLAAGRRAQALHDGAFVWGDTTEADFSSTGIDQFLIRASGGVGIGTNDPQADLDVAGVVRATSFEGSGAPLTLATTDTNGLQFQVNSTLALELLYPTIGTVPNIIGGYSGNSIAPGNEGAVIGGGGTPLGASPNTINPGSDYAVIAGGARNTAAGDLSTIGGGIDNRTDGLFSVVPGGSLNAATADHTFAAGYRAKAGHRGAFVWADSTDADFASTGSDQFLIRANGGVGIGTGAPTADLHIASAGSAALLLEADNDNLNESDHPSIAWSQDGGLITAGMGFFDGTNDLRIRSADSGDGKNDILLEPEGAVKITRNLLNTEQLLHLKFGADQPVRGGLMIEYDVPASLGGADRPGIIIKAPDDSCGHFFFDDNSTGPGNYNEFNYNHAQDQYEFIIAGEKEMVIESTGEVGIGTQDPKKNLHLHADSTNGPDIFFTNSDTGTSEGSDGVQLGMDSGERGFFWNYETSSSGALYFGAGNAERMRITNTGLVGIGTSSPSATLSVLGTANNTTGTWGFFSDRRMKEDIAPMEPGSLDRLLGLEGVSYHYKDEKMRAANGQPNRGWIAQDVEKVFPEWVSETDEGMKMVTPVGFRALAVEALRELRTEKDEEISALEKENSTLKRETDDLRKRLERLEAAVFAQGQASE